MDTQNDQPTAEPQDPEKDKAAKTEASASPAEGEKQEQAGRGAAPAGEARPHYEGGRPDLGPELARLVLLTTKYPEIGPPLAELAFKAGYPEEGDQILRMAMGGEAPGIDFFFVAARQARHTRRWEDALRACVDAVRAVAAAPERYADPDDAGKLLHLVRLGFSVLLFDLKDPHGSPAFIEGLAAALPGLGLRLDADPFYHSLLAQVLWYSDKEAGEREWDLAAERGEPEFTFNARGTWYKEAERDPEKAERAYRQGLERAPQSPLLAHNLAQLLLDKAGRLKDERPGEARRAINEGDALVRTALQGDCPGGLRRHIYSTRAELAALRNSLRGKGDEGEALRPRPAPPKLEVGQVLTGRISSLTTFGAFVNLGGGVTGLLHKTELAHEYIADPAQLVQVGQQIEVKIIDMQESEGGRPRVGLSRKALLPPPPPGTAQPQQEGRRRDGGPRQDRPRDDRPRQEGRREGGPRQDRPRDDRPRQEGRRDDRPGDRPRQEGRRDDRPSDRPPRDDRPREERERAGITRQPGPGKLNTDARIASLGEMLLAKLKEQESK